jgi:DNA-binding protein H-NS
MATLMQIQARIAKLQAKADSVKQKQQAAVMTRISKMMNDNDVSIDALQAFIKPGPGRKRLVTSASRTAVATDTPKRRGRPPGSKNGAAKPTKAVASKSKKGLPAKYRNPETGDEWSGWARPPAWIANVKDRTKFLINPNDDGAITLGPRKASAKKAATRAVVLKKPSSKKASRKAS